MINIGIKVPKVEKVELDEVRSSSLREKAEGSEGA